MQTAGPLPCGTANVATAAFTCPPSLACHVQALYSVAQLKCCSMACPPTLTPAGAGRLWTSSRCGLGSTCDTFTFGQADSHLCGYVGEAGEVKEPRRKPVRRRKESTNSGEVWTSLGKGFRTKSVLPSHDDAFVCVSGSHRMPYPT